MTVLAMQQTLRSQLAALQRSHEATEQELQRMRAAVQLREQELSRASRMLAESSLVAPFNGRTDSHAQSLRRRGSERPVVAESSEGGRPNPSVWTVQQLQRDSMTGRMVDQLNSQVDFLNEQLAAREAQIRDLHAALAEAQQDRSGRRSSRIHLAL